MAIASFTGAQRESQLTGDQLYDVRSYSRSRINVGSRERWLSVLAGGALALYGMNRRSKVGGVLALAGAALAYRGATGHCNVYQTLGVNRASGAKGTGRLADRGSDTRERLGGHRGVHVEASVTIRRPVAEVYRFWRNLENLATFMEHLEQVVEREEGISHWVARGPAGVAAEWDARIINDIDNKLIAWQSLEGSMISTAGSVNFTESVLGTTVRVHFQYDPPAGRLGDAVARLFGEDPNRTVQEDLQRLKKLLEPQPIVRGAEG